MPCFQIYEWAATGIVSNEECKDFSHIPFPDFIGLERNQAYIYFWVFTINNFQPWEGHFFLPSTNVTVAVLTALIKMCVLKMVNLLEMAQKIILSFYNNPFYEMQNNFILWYSTSFWKNVILKEIANTFFISLCKDKCLLCSLSEHLKIFFNVSSCGTIK